MNRREEFCHHPVQTEYQIGTLRVATLLEARSKADRLTVVLNGYCDRSRRTPPVFLDWPKSSETFGHILRISDPSLFLSDWITGSCFFGTEAENPIPAVVSCSKQIARQLGVQENRVVYFGHSGAASAPFSVQFSTLPRARLRSIQFWSPNTTRSIILQRK